MNIIALAELSDCAAAGSKAWSLGEMLRVGFPVPEGYAIGVDVCRDIMHENEMDGDIDALLAGLAPENAGDISDSICEKFDKLALPASFTRELSEYISEDCSYAVRSSGTSEDLEGFSFAGQYETVLDVRGAEEIANAVKRCWRSMYSETVLSYLANKGINVNGLGMGVIVQKMIHAEQSGVIFTANPMTGADTEIVIEAASGVGERLVGGMVRAERYAYDWFAAKHTLREGELLSAELVEALSQEALGVQLHFGYPCDIEFAIADGELYLLQSRPITKLRYSGIPDQWTTADFKDGGVSATVCRPYMWSLYEYIWEHEFCGFLLDAKILKRSQLRKSGNMFFGRPYWNLSIAKAAMSKVPGYKERDFDSDLGVAITYDGNGQVTKITPASLFAIARMALAQRKIVSERRKNADRLKRELLEKYEDYRARINVPYMADEFKGIWKRLIFDDYLFSEGTYFRQIFINTIHQSLFKDKLLKHTSQAGYFRLIGGLDNVSHLLPFYDMWDASRLIREDSAAFGYWTDTSAEAIHDDFRRGMDKFYLDRVREHIERFGYHSEKELDVAWPCYYEDTLTVIAAFRDTVALGEDCSPITDRERMKKDFSDEMEAIRRCTGDKLTATVNEMRELLWWREEFRDLSTRFYYLIRIYTLRLADYLLNEGVLENTDDIWFTKIEDLRGLIDGKISSAALRGIIARNRKYYTAYRNFMSENEIGSVFQFARETSKKPKLCGIGCSCNTITGTARVIGGLEETNRLREGDILVTRFTDTGWTSKFAMLGGIVTEYGGILCHAAIVSREYGIPCVVCADGATTRIPDGALITINGETGEITM